jgi:hypothetical protein
MFDDLYSSIGEFTEGAWESISTGAQSALGDWAGGAEPTATTQGGETVTTGTTGTTGTTATTAKPAMMGLDNQTLLIGGGLLLVAVLLFK